MLFHLSGLTNIDRIEDPLENVIMEDDDLRVIRALSNRSRSAWGADFVRGKGLGQIVLLHGLCLFLHIFSNVNSLLKVLLVLERHIPLVCCSVFASSAILCFVYLGDDAVNVLSDCSMLCTFLISETKLILTQQC